MEQKDGRPFPAPGQRLKRVPPVLHVDSRSGRQVIKQLKSTEGSGEDSLREVNVATGETVHQSSRDKEIGYSLVPGTEVPKNLAEGLRTNRAITRRKSASKEPAIHAEFEDPPENIE
jgi:hypothetical protein